MSRTAVIVALVVTLGLAAAAFFLLRSGPPSASVSGPLLKFDPARVIELRVDFGESFQAVRRARVVGDWTVVLGSGGGKGGESSWPADPARMRAALRILSTLEGEPAAAADPRGWPMVTVATEDGASHRMAINPRTLAGKAAAAVGEKPIHVQIPADVAQMLVASGPREWRDARAIPGIGPDVARITLRGHAGTVALARVQGRWGLRSPLAVPADPEAIVRLVTGLSGITVADYLDQGPPGQTGLGEPIAELTIESDARNPDGSSATLIRTLRVGGPADVGGRAVFAELRSGDDAPPRVVSVLAESLAALSTDPAAYIARKAVSSSSMDIGEIVIRWDAAERRFMRDLDGWKRPDGGEHSTPLPKAQSEPVDALLQLLTQTNASAVVIGEQWPEQWGAAPAASPVEISLRSIGGDPLAELAVIDASPVAIGPAVIVRDGSVWRQYKEAPAPIRELLRASP